MALCSLSPPAGVRGSLTRTARGAAPSPGSLTRSDLSPQAGRGEGLRHFVRVAGAGGGDPDRAEVGKLDEVVENSLKGAALWDEVKDRLHESGLALSGGQQQRLCIARALAGDPEVLLLDEPCSALDPIATGKIEDLMQELRGAYSVLIVTHKMQQAARTSDYTAFMYLGRVIEYGPTTLLFTNPHVKDTQDYITGRFG